MALAGGGVTYCDQHSDGTTTCWGGAYVGDGTTTPTAIPTQVAFPDYASLTFAGYSCLIDGENELSCWGAFFPDTLGESGMLPLFPSPVRGLPAVTRVAPWAISCAVTAAAAVWCWDANDDGGQGVGYASGDMFAPHAVPGLHDALGVTVGSGGYACAWFADGSAHCWGSNFSGTLGDGTFVDRAAPAPVGGLDGVEKLSAGYETICALRSDHSIWCWGDGYDGLLGDTFKFMPYEDGWSPLPVEIDWRTGLAEADQGTAL